MEAISEHRTKRALGGFVTAVLLASVLSIAAVSAQTSSGSDCSGEFFSDLSGIQLLVGSVTTADVSLSTPIPAGTYQLNAASRDEHEGRESTDPQPQEQWVVELLDVNGTVLATSQPTADLEDNTPSAFWSGAIGSVTLAADAVSARVVHAAPTSSSPNSVFPVCFGATAVESGTPGSDPVPADPVPVTSSLILDFDSDAAATASAAVICDLSADTDTGNQIDITIDGIEPGSECIVAYPLNFDCSVAVDPASAVGAEGAGDVTIAFPVDVATTVLVDIDCIDEDVAAVTLPGTTPPAPVVTTTTTAPAAAVTTTTVAQAAAVTTTTAASAVTTTTVASSAAQTTPTAPAAQPRVGTPAFTG